MEVVELLICIRRWCVGRCATQQLSELTASPSGYKPSVRLYSPPDRPQSNGKEKEIGFMHLNSQNQENILIYRLRSGLPYSFWKNKSRLMRSSCCLCVCVSASINFWRPEPVFMKLGTWAHLNGVLHKSLPSVCVSVCFPPIVARQRLARNVTAAVNTQAPIEKLLNASFYMRSVSYKKK
jgi:hypothetical protein